MKTVSLRRLSAVPIRNGLGLPGINNDPSDPRYIRTTDIATPTALKDDTFVSQPPDIAAQAVVEYGDLLLVSAGASVGKSCLYLSRDLACYAGFLTRVRPESISAGQFLSYWTQSSHFIDQVRSTAVQATIENFSAARYKELRVPVMSDEQQERIIRFLDVETAKIDHLIAKQREVMALLVERENVRRNWILELVDGPEVRLKCLFAPSRLRSVGGEEVLSVYRDYGVIKKASRTDNFNITPEDTSRYLVVNPGDLVVNKMKAWQGSMGISKLHGIVSGDYEVLRPSRQDVNLQFLHYLLRSRRLVDEYAIHSKGIRPSQWRLYWQDLSEIKIPLPSLSEQEAIVSSIEETELSHTALTACLRMIELLEERRSALITAAVTGQIEV